MAQVYLFPRGRIVQDNGEPTPQARGYLVGLENVSKAIAEVSNLDPDTSYSADDLRDKVIEILTALQG